MRWYVLLVKMIFDHSQNKEEVYIIVSLRCWQFARYVSWKFWGYERDDPIENFMADPSSELCKKAERSKSDEQGVVEQHEVKISKPADLSKRPE